MVTCSPTMDFVVQFNGSSRPLKPSLPYLTLGTKLLRMFDMNISWEKYTTLKQVHDIKMIPITKNKCSVGSGNKQKQMCIRDRV